ncbi:MFS transporter [Salmonella enterica subsp. enterica serovar Enteritidis]|nr:MFS transporter [Salmonella enterica subsp. enterica serovar Enteritidis]
MNTNVYENTDSETITPLNKRRILPVFLLVGLYAASTAAVMSVLPFYIREMGGSPLIIGIIIATEAFSQFCAAPLIGHLSDRVGRKRILIVTLAIAAISLLLLANAQCILFILLARTLFGISAGNLSAAAAYIADCTHVRNRRQAIGILTGCIGLGGIVGAGVSGWLSRISLSAPIYAAFILVLGSALVAIWGLKDPSTTSRTTDKIAAFSARAILNIVPNMNHYSINQFAEESLVPFINRFQSKKTLPQLIGLIHHHLLTVYFSEAPVKVVRWTANNPNARDFRYACGIRYKPLTIDIPANNKISITLNEPKTGWEATYIEATFNDGYVATSQVYITPDEKYPQTAPPSVNAACQTLPGRGLGENDSPD